MKLVDLEIIASSSNGWGSGKLVFGEDLTQLHGPNGCGKTPVIQSIAYALGYPVKYREDILQHCKNVVLRVSLGEGELIIKRMIGGETHIECIYADNDRQIFYNIKDYSRYLFKLVGLPITVLTSNSNKPTYAYLSTLLPLFYVDQDIGYSQAYKSPENFIKDQYAEMVRLSLGIPAKHSFENKRIIFEKKQLLNELDGHIVTSEQFINGLTAESGFSNQSIASIDQELLGLKAKYDNLNTGEGVASEVISALSYLIREKQEEKHNLQIRTRNLQERISSIHRIKEEIELEINTLSLNEDARRVFSTFNDICARKDCKLFLNSSESYGKSLLYLRDQIKDLDRNTKYQSVLLEELSEQTNNLDANIKTLRSSIAKENKDMNSEGLVSVISEIYSSIMDLQRQKEIVTRLESEKEKYVDFLNRRKQLQNDIASIQAGSGSIDLRSIEFRKNYKTKIIDWLEVLSTKNVSRNITIDADFRIKFGNEKISQFSGSTLLRVVLALRAAFFDLRMSYEIPTIEFLVFDTPRQHDIEEDHFSNFINRLKMLAKSSKAQVVFSTTEYRYDIGINDKEWRPTFEGPEQKMFLGALS